MIVRVFKRRLGWYWRLQARNGRRLRGHAFRGAD